MEQQRRHPRRNVEIPIRAWSITSDPTRAIHGHCLNLSEGGAGAIIAGPWKPGQVVTMQLNLSPDSQPIIVEARLSHRNQLHCGFEFLGTSELVMTQLRNACAEA
jgi:c-di-GMP-binding flagellar brake protein YcgR